MSIAILGGNENAEEDVTSWHTGHWDEQQSEPGTGSTMMACLAVSVDTRTSNTYLSKATFGVDSGGDVTT